MKSNVGLKFILCAIAPVSLWLSGCGGGTSANQIAVAVNDSLGGVVVVTQADTILGTVSGPNTINGVVDAKVAFVCTYTTTTVTGTTSKTSADTPCVAAVGTLSNATDTTVIYTAPAVFPDPTTYPGLLLKITGTADADKKKTNFVNLRIDSGIRVTIAPTAATLAVGNGTTPGEFKTFTAGLTTDTVPNDVTWGVTNSTVNTGGTPSIAGTYTLTTPTCTTTVATTNCGSVDQNGKFTAPSALPTNTTVILYAISKKDTNRVAIATITLVNGGVIKFNSLWPTVVPQGGSQADVFLNATHLTSQIGLSLKFVSAIDGSTTTTPIDAGSNAVKAFFTPSSYTATTGPVSTGARLRLTADQLKTPGTYTVTITPGNLATQGNNPIAMLPFQVVPVRPGLVASYPSNLAQGATNQNITFDGGYYGASDGATVGLSFNNSSLVATPGTEPRRLTGQVQSTSGISGLVPVSVRNSLDVNNPSTAYSNIAVLPSYANVSVAASLPYDINNVKFPPCVAITNLPTCQPADANGNTPTRNPACVPSTNPPVSCSPYPAALALGAPKFTAAATKPSAIAVNSTIGYAAVTEAGTDTVQFINLNSPGLTMSAPFSTGLLPTGNLPTGVAIDHNVCTTGTPGNCTLSQNIAAVVNYQAQTLTILSIPGGTLIETIDLSKLIPPSEPAGTNTNPSPNPYSVGIDPFTHRALVAFASTDAGFVINLDQTQAPSICLPGFIPSDGTSYCPVAYADLNTGPNPQIAFESGAHLAYVTPGGSGLLTAVNLSNPAKTPLKILSATRSGNVVTVTMEPSTPHNLVPGSQQTILISGLPLGAGSPTANPPIPPSSFNGAFPLLTVTSNLTFTYAQTGPNDTTTSTATQQGYLNAGNNTLSYQIDPHIQGIDINPVTHSLAFANPNASFSQISFIDSLNQTVNSLNLCKDSNLAIYSSNPPPCTSEVGVSAVAFQPFTNTVVSLNATLNQLSLIDPSAGQRVTIVPISPAPSVQTVATTISFTPHGVTTPTTINLTGAVAVDAIHNLALAVNSGSGTITPLYLATIKPLQIESVSTPPVDMNANGVLNTGVTSPAIIAQSVLIDSMTAPTPVAGIRIFGTGFSGSSQVRLDGIGLPPSDVVFVSANELDITLPVTNGTQTILTAPRNFGLDIANPDGSTSNVMDLRVIESVRIPPAPPCAVASAPGAVAIADDLVGTGKNYAIVTETACKAAAVISLNHDGTFGSLAAIGTGGNPFGVATIPRFGYAVVTNNADGTVSILDLTKGTRAAGATTDVVVGTQPTGVAIEQETGLAVVANTGSNTATVIDLTPLQATPLVALTPITVATDQEPVAVAIDPDRGGNATGLAVITSLNISTTPPSGALDSVDISLATPAKNNLATSSIGSIPTGIVFDPASSPARLFYAIESDSNAFISYNPDGGGANTVRVGINPQSIAYNFQTSTILTVNAASNTVSVIDAQTFQNKATLGIGGASLFSAAIEPFANLAVIADQANNRVLLFPLPH